MTSTTQLDIAGTATQLDGAEGAAWIILADNHTATEGHDDGHGDASHDEGHADEATGHESMDHDQELLGTDLHTELGHAESSGGMPQFDTTTFANQFVWLVLALVAIYFILAKIGLPRIGGVLEQRSNTIQRDLDRAAELKSKAEEAEANYQQALIDARAKAQGIAEDAKTKANAKLDEAIAEADKQIDKQAKASSKRIASMQQDADKSVAEIAKDVTSAVIEAINPGVKDDKLVDKTLAKLLKG